MSTPVNSRSKLPVLAFVAMVLVVTFAAAIRSDSSASHDFNDVPTNMLFHAEVSKIRDAGITTGCGGGNFCPTDFVQRRAMAAFMTRGFGRVAMSYTFIQDTISDSDGLTKIGEVTIDVPGSGSSATQFVEVRAQVTVDDSLGVCNCTLLTQLWEPPSQASVLGEEMLNTNEFDTIQLSWVFEASPTGLHTYELWALTIGADLDLDLRNLVLTATTYPFGATGGNVLSTQASEPSALSAATPKEGLTDAMERPRAKKP